MGAEQRQLSPGQLGALALTAAEVPALRVCTGLSWFWVLPGAVAAAGLLSLLTALLNRRSRRRSSRRGRLSVTLPLMPGLLGLSFLAAAEAAAAFPETADSPLAAGLVLLLAAYAASKGAAAAGRCAGILLWITGALCGIVLAVSIPEIQLRWLRPAGEPTQALIAFLSLLLPGTALGLEPVLEKEKKLPHWQWWIGSGLALLGSIVTGGILSPAVASRGDAFQTLARGVSVLGVMRRFEALVNAAMLMNAFCLCTLLLSALRVRLGWLSRQGTREEEDSGLVQAPASSLLRDERL